MHHSELLDACTLKMGLAMRAFGGAELEKVA